MIRKNNRVSSRRILSLTVIGFPSQTQYQFYGNPQNVLEGRKNLSIYTYEIFCVVVKLQT